MFTVRRYTSSDQQAVEQLHVAAMQQMGAYLGRGPWDDDIYTIDEVYLRQGGEFLIGEDDNQVVAMGALKHTTEERAEIKRMRVAPEYQGRGFGERILITLEARAYVLGYRILHLDTSIVQIPAQKLYEKHGFSEVGRDMYQQEVGKNTYQPLEVILYEKRIR